MRAEVGLLVVAGVVVAGCSARAIDGPMAERASAIASAVWEERKPPVAPTARDGHAMAYDRKHGQVVLFGGSTADGVSDETWTWDGATWTQHAVAAPPARFETTMAWDDARSLLLLFGGETDPPNETYFGDTWGWDGAAWTELATTGPSARGNVGMAYDASRQVVVLTGGYGTAGLAGDTWEWNGTSWALRDDAGLQPSMLGPMLVYDAKAELSIIAEQADVWSWNGSTWAETNVAVGPASMSWGASVYDGPRARTVLFGGAAGPGVGIGETWEWDGASWTSLGKTGPAPRTDFAMAFDEQRRRIVLFGGTLDGLATGGDTWEYHPHGDACTTDAACDTGHCVDGVCCESVCGACETCAAASTAGTCTTVKSAPDDDTCTGKSRCDAVGACKTADGQACQSASECAAGGCHAGICCDPACKLGCDLHGACITFASCTDSHTASGGGQTTDCSPYACAADKGCLDACQSVDDCAPGFVCGSGTCTAAPPAASGDSGSCALAWGRGGSGGRAAVLALLSFGLATSLARARRRRRSEGSASV